MDLDDQALNNFLEYLRIPSVHPNPNYDGCLKFLEKQANELGLPFKIYSIVPDNPIIVITWEGLEPCLPAILLNSHMDVVPVYPESWKYSPFEGHIDECGNIFARGTQDMKSIGIQYIEAIRRLKLKGLRLRRTVHMSFVPDEEMGGVKGMSKFVLTNEFRDLNIGFSLDEGLPSPNEEFLLFNGERTNWRLTIRCPGQAGHGSLLPDNTAGEKIHYIIDKFMRLRKQEKDKLENNPELTLGDVTTINLTVLQGGLQVNVLPEELTVLFNVRIALTVDLPKLEEMFTNWCKEAGEGVHIDFGQKLPLIEATKLDCSNPFWGSFKKAIDDMGIKLKTGIFPAATDSRYIRQIGIPAFGFSPINNTKVLLHDHDECLNKTVFFKGIRIYEEIITAIGNV